MLPAPLVHQKVDGARETVVIFYSFFAVSPWKAVSHEVLPATLVHRRCVSASEIVLFYYFLIVSISLKWVTRAGTKPGASRGRYVRGCGFHGMEFGRPKGMFLHTQNTPIPSIPIRTSQSRYNGSTTTTSPFSKTYQPVVLLGPSIDLSPCLRDPPLSHGV